MRWLLRLRAAAARPKGAPLVFRSFFVFVFSFSFLKKGKTKKEKAVPMRWLLRLRAAAARAKSAPLVFRSFFCLLKKLCFSFLLSLFSFFFKKKTVLFFFVVLFFLKKKTGLSRDACAARGCRGFRCQSIRRALYLLCLCLFCL